MVVSKKTNPYDARLRLGPAGCQVQVLRVFLSAGFVEKVKGKGWAPRLGPQRWSTLPTLPNAAFGYFSPVVPAPQNRHTRQKITVHDFATLTRRASEGPRWRVGLVCCRVTHSDFRALLDKWQMTGMTQA